MNLLIKDNFRLSLISYDDLSAFEVLLLHFGLIFKQLDGTIHVF